MVWDSNSVFSLRSTFYRRWWAWATERWRNSARVGSVLRPELKFYFKEITLGPAVANGASLLRCRGRLCWLAHLGQCGLCATNAPISVSIANLPLLGLRACITIHLPYLLLEKTFEGRPDKLCLLLGFQSKKPRGWFALGCLQLDFCGYCVPSNVRLYFVFEKTKWTHGIILNFAVVTDIAEHTERKPAYF